jgi:hypothetical protein
MAKRSSPSHEPLWLEQGVPLLLTVATFLILCLVFSGVIHLLNLLPAEKPISVHFRLQDIVVGLTIYVKTAIDFAIFIGNLMCSNPGWRKRIAIEVGTAVGNALGTVFILVIWNFFREVPWLMAIMIVIAALVLLRMAEESLNEFLEASEGKRPRLHRSISFVERQLAIFNNLVKPILGKLIPNMSITNIKQLPFLNLAVFSFTVPFILGLDDFAGYIPLFNVVSVFGFAIGVFLGHMLLNFGLFVSPKHTTAVVRNPLVLIVGGLAFVAIALWGFYEVIHLLSVTYFF